MLCWTPIETLSHLHCMCVQPINQHKGPLKQPYVCIKCRRITRWDYWSAPLTISLKIACVPSAIPQILHVCICRFGISSRYRQDLAIIHEQGNQFPLSWLKLPFRWKCSFSFLFLLENTNSVCALNLGPSVTLESCSGKCHKTCETSHTYVGTEICAIMSSLGRWPLRLMSTLVRYPNKNLADDTCN